MARSPSSAAAARSRRRTRIETAGLSSLKYDAPKPDLAEEDRTIGGYKLNLRPENVRVVPVDSVFAK